MLKRVPPLGQPESTGNRIQRNRNLPDDVRLYDGSAFIPRLSKLQEAFSLAHTKSQTASSQQDKRDFRRVADLIWQSCGGSK